MFQGVSRDYTDDDAVYEEKMAVDSQPMLRLGKVKSRLFIDCATERDEGVYTCVAETPFERISQSTILKMGMWNATLLSITFLLYKSRLRQALLWNTKQSKE